MASVADPDLWELIKEQSGRYGVSALVAYAARQHLPASERQWCDEVLLRSWRRHEKMLRHVEFVTSLLSQAGIRTISLKGPLLAQRYYTPAFLRKTSMDADLAVCEEDLGLACRLLIGVGYSLDMPLAEALKQTHHVELSHPARPKVELHFRLSHRALGIPVREFFDRAIPWQLPNGLQTLVLGAADQILHLVLHLVHTRFGTLFHLYEIRRVASKEPMEARVEAVNRAIEHHYCGALRMMDIASRFRWQEPFLPPDLELPKTWLNSRLTPELYCAFERWSLPGRGLSLMARIEARWLDLQLTDRPIDTLRRIAFFITTAKHYFTQWRAWGTVKELRFAPHHLPPPVRRDVSDE